MTPKAATLYQLFDASSLQNAERQMKAGERITAGQLADIIAADPGAPRPRWFDALLVKALRGELKLKPGRRKESCLAQFRFAAAAYEYRGVLKGLLADKEGPDPNPKPTTKPKTKRRPDGLPGPCDPAHQRAAEIIIKEWRLAMSWRAFLNRVSSEK